MDSKIISHAELLNLLHYDPDTGLFKWLVAGRNQHQKVGAVAGSLKPNGYIEMKIGGRMYKAHRLAWLYVHGEWPDVIDHISRVRNDNRISNLRSCTKKQNMSNLNVYANSSSGFRGVSFHKDTSKWQVIVSVNGKRTHFGLYDDVELAGLVAQEVRVKYHGEFAS